MTSFDYHTGFGSEHRSETTTGLLPGRGNSPQRTPLGLFAEQLSGSAFTAPRHENRRTWMYRTRPSVVHLADLEPIDFDHVLTSPPHPDAGPNPATQLKWRPATEPPAHTSWRESLRTVITNGDARLQAGGAVHTYRFSPDGTPSPVFVNLDAEMLVIPLEGTLIITTELGRLTVTNGEIAVIPRAMKIAVDSTSDMASGWLNENYGRHYTLPENGPIGLNALAMPKDFEYPTAWFETETDRTQLVAKFGGRFFAKPLHHSPFDVMAWTGNHAPYRYDLARFCPVGPTLFDHPDPSLGTVLTSPSDLAGTANLDFVIFPERWLVAEDTFRPPWFHTNVMSEFMGLLRGSYDAKPGHEPGTMTLHNQNIPHGPTAAVHQQASTAELAPEKLEGTLAFMLESRYVWDVAPAALNDPALDADYPSCWADLADPAKPTT